MSENRLNGLAQMHIHRRIEINPGEVLDQLAMETRKIDLIFVKRLFYRSAVWPFYFHNNV